MCGITGYSLGEVAAISQDALYESLRRIMHRGPDDSGVFRDEDKGIGLGHARLSILDLSPMGHQPMFENQGGMVLVYNGEVYNYLELRESLSKHGDSFQGHSDTEVILRLFEDHAGEEAHWTTLLPRLNGIFAFALWDPHTEELRVARDAMGVKPLYYVESADRFAFASEIKALFPLVPGLSEIDPKSIDRYLTYLWCPGAGTPLRQVRKLEPGQALTVKRGRILEKHQWFNPRYTLKGSQSHSETSSSKDPEHWIQGTRDRLREAVQRQMVSDVPVGAFLSGGLDSSSIVTFARELNPGIRCFTIQATNWELDEVTDDLPYAVEVARHLNVPLEIVPIDSGKMASDFAEMVVHLDEPLADPASLNVLYISLLARETGIKVLLSGAGGDDILTGYRRHRALLMEDWWAGLPLFARSALQGMTSVLGSRFILARRLKKMFRGATLPAEERLMDYFRWMDTDSLRRLYTPDFTSSLKGERSDEPLRNMLAQLPEGLSPVERMLALEQRFFLADHNLIYTDKMSMAAGVEVRVPFLDMDFVEYASGIPWPLKQRGKEGKWVLKKAMEPYLPKSVIYRRKSGFGAPLRRWIRFELREMIGDILSEQSLRNRGIFDPVAVKRMIDDNEKGRIDASYTILSLLLIELWCRRFIDVSVKS
jgi:asparagine synthase (glutamine-hydrolysing)